MIMRFSEPSATWKLPRNSEGRIQFYCIIFLHSKDAAHIFPIFWENFSMLKNPRLIWLCFTKASLGKCPVKFFGDKIKKLFFSASQRREACFLLIFCDIIKKTIWLCFTKAWSKFPITFFGDKINKQFGSALQKREASFRLLFGDKYKKYFGSVLQNSQGSYKKFSLHNFFSLHNLLNIQYTVQTVGRRTCSRKGGGEEGT